MNNAGFSLAEVMVSATLGAVILGSALDMFVTQHYHYKGQQTKAELQQDLRGGVHLLESELRLAGRNATTSLNHASLTAYFGPTSRNRRAVFGVPSRPRGGRGPARSRSR